MLVFTIFSYFSLYLGLAFCALCLACGLYYISELSEEYTILTKRILRVTNYVILFVHIVLFIFEPISWYCILVGIFSHVTYHQLLRSFPFVTIKQGWSVTSIVCFFLSHIVWFFFFAEYNPDFTFSFFELIGFFFSCVWLVPGAFFVTLSVEDEMIIFDKDERGMLDSTPINILRKKEKKSIISVVVSQTIGWITGLFSGNIRRDW